MGNTLAAAAFIFTFYSSLFLTHSYFAVMISFLIKIRKISTREREVYYYYIRVCVDAKEACENVFLSSRENKKEIFFSLFTFHFKNRRTRERNCRMDGEREREI